MHGSAYANYAVRDCDLLLAFGVRFDDRVTGRLDAFSPNSKKIHIDIDVSQINKNVQMIDLTGNPIEEQGLVAVSRLLKNNSILEYVGLDLLRTNVKLGMYGAGARDAPPGTPPVDKNVVRALQRIRRDERVVGDGGIGPFKLFQDVHSTSFIVSPRWIDEGIAVGNSLQGGNGEPQSRLSFLGFRTHQPGKKLLVWHTGRDSDPAMISQ